MNSAMIGTKLALICLLIGVHSPPTFAQQEIDKLLGDVFSTERTPTLNQRNRGFGTVLQPEADTNPSAFQPVANSSPCQCVAYHLCDPKRGIMTGGQDIAATGGGGAINPNTVTSDAEFDWGLIDVRFEKDECPEVLDVCCADSNKRTETIPVPPLTQMPNRPQGCGIRNVGGIDFKLVNNEQNEAGFGEFPWTVALIRISDDKCLCGGSLISNRVVLIANHCIVTEQPNTMKIRAGEWDTQSTGERLPYQERNVARVASHPAYNTKSLYNDVALLYLEQPFVLADHIGVVCLPRQAEETFSTACIMTGWGKDQFGQIGKRSVIQKRVVMPSVANTECQSRLQQTRLTNKFRLHDSFMCAGGIPGKDACQGDGGAPLACPVGPATDNRYTQYGIVSWGIGCHGNVPGVYSRVATFRNWIDQTMLGWSLTTDSYTFKA